MNQKVLIKGGWVLTLGAKTPNHTGADVLIENGRISEVGSGLRERGADVVDGTGSVVMPGFVDTHRHVARSLYRNTGELSTVEPSHYQPDDMYAATLIGLLGAVETGITTVVDWVDAPDAATLEAALEAHRDSGVRGVTVHGELREAGGLTTTSFASSDVKDVHRHVIPTQWEKARSAGSRIHAHAGVEEADKGTVSDLRELLAHDVTLVHCSKLDDEDLEAVAFSGASVVITPASEMAGGMGAPQVQQLIDRNIRPGLGVDDERVAPGDIFAQMRATISLQHATYFDLKLAGKGGLPNLLKTRDVIRYATVDGARAVGLHEETGSIEPGKRADIVVLKGDSPNIFPINDPIGAVVWGMDTSNVEWVFVEGRAVVSHGALNADIQKTRSLAIQAQRRVATAAGISAAAGDSA